MSKFLDEQAHLGVYRNRISANSGWLLFVDNELGVILCPICKVEMESLGVTAPFLSSHYRCPNSNLIFYGDKNGMALCRHPKIDVKL
jgi:hypothetical protein